MSEASNVLLTSEVARRLGISAAYVRRLADMGKLQSKRASRGVRLFMEKDVDALAIQRSRQEAERNIPSDDKGSEKQP